MASSRRFLRAVSGVLLSLALAGCVRGHAATAAPSVAFLAEGSPDPSIEFLGDVYMLAAVAERDGLVTNDFYPAGQSPDSWTKTILAFVAPQGVSPRQIVDSHLAQRQSRLAAKPFVTVRTRYDEEWIMVIVLLVEDPDQIQTEVMHVFANKGERARAYIHSEKKLHDAGESEDERLQFAKNMLQAMERLEFPLKRPSAGAALVVVVDETE